MEHIPPRTTQEHMQAPRSWSRTVESERHPERNEDSSILLDQPGTVRIAGVFDGLGGNAGSQLASDIAATCVRNIYVTYADTEMSRPEAAAFAKQVIDEAHRCIVQDEHSRIATTAAIASIHTDPEVGDQYANIAWAGDSRVYVIRNGEIIYRTLDDAQPLFSPELDQLYPDEAPEYRAQRFLEDVMSDETISPVLGELLLRRNVIDNCLGANQSSVTTHVHQIPVSPGDRILTTSDGIHDNLSTEEILSIINSDGPADDLICAAITRSRDTDHPRAKPDDMTAVMLVV